MADGFYVYVYIDPRNNEEFYFGKGTGSRKNAHLEDGSDTEKTRRIAAIKAEGLRPVIRIVARDLTESEAFLVEATLLWRIRHGLTNIASGHFQSKFRPANTLHKELSGFDYDKRIHFFNVGQQQGGWRSWDDSREFGFVSAGGGEQWADAVRALAIGDVVAGYASGRGFVGVGVVVAEGRPVREVSINGQPLLTLPVQGKALRNTIESDETCEWVAVVEWLATVTLIEGKKMPGLIRRQTRSLLEPDSDVVAFLETAFNIDIRALTV